MMEIPWLGHLRREPDPPYRYVPFVNRWGPERMENLTAAFDPNVKSMAVFCMDEREREPDYKAQSPQRQRLCMTAGLCQVCGRPVPWKRRQVVVSSVSTQTITLDGEERTVVIEPWLDKRCAEIAITWCPALIRRETAADLFVHQVTKPQDVEIILSTGWVEGQLEAQTRAHPVAMWAKLALMNLEVLRVRM